jgi:transcriptional regulator with XRE-family HTH domain/tetratricopeptide (TPR) repeat protein
MTRYRLGGAMARRTVWVDGERVRQWREQQGWSQGELASRAGKAKRTVESLENNSHTVLLHTLRAVAEALDVAPHELLAACHGAAPTDDASAAPTGPPGRADGPPGPQGLESVKRLGPSMVPEAEIRLPVTGEYLLGRAREIERLDRIWSDNRANILGIFAWGGTGKSALVNHWLGHLARDGWRGAERVFGWTFYSQGTRDTVASADGFLEAALRFCGDPKPGADTPWDKGHRLARLMREKRTLLVLDGLEPLQYPPGPQAGRVKDPALAALLRALALSNPGLCVITSRLAVADLAAWHATTVEVMQLDALSEAAGAAFLAALGVHGSEAERCTASRAFGGHALALHLLGTYLRDAGGGDIHRRHDMARPDDWAEPGGQAWRVMGSYERWFGNGPEVAVLRLLGLFDRTATAAEVRALRTAPGIPGLTEALVGLSERQWSRVLQRLRTAGLVARPDSKAPGTLDAHPLVREYYRQQLYQEYPEAWRAGHERLYAHLQETVLEGCPTTMEAMVPLYEAVAHGCLAGRPWDALGIFRQRIRRGEQYFGLEQLGAFGADLAVLSHFFEVLWSKVVAGVPEPDRLFLFHAVGECLSALGRVLDAEEPLQRALTLARCQENWTTAALSATRLSEVARAQGDLATAVCLAKMSVEYACRPGVPAQVALLSTTFLGFAEFWSGHVEAATGTFRQAERLQQQANPERSRLGSISGYMYCELLLDRLERQVGRLTSEQFERDWRALCERIQEALMVAEQENLARDIGLTHVSAGRLWMLAWLRQVADAGAGALTAPHGPYAAAPPAIAQARTHVMHAVECLRESDQINYLPRALLTRAALYRLQGHLDLAHADVDEVLDIAQSTSMDFYRADAYLEKAALHLAASRGARQADHSCKARGYVTKAEELIDSMGYRRRSPWVAELKRLLQQGVAD